LISVEHCAALEILSISGPAYSLYWLSFLNNTIWLPIWIFSCITLLHRR
jgi:hypothetical protein